MFVYNGIKYVTGETQCGVCHKVFNYVYIPGSPPSSLFLCFACDFTFPKFEPDVFMHAGGEITAMQVVPAEQTHLFKKFYV